MDCHDEQIASKLVLLTTKVIAPTVTYPAQYCPAIRAGWDFGPSR